MIIAPANPNSVHVGMVRIGCFKTQFNSAYPTRLNGVISQNEFRESINNINSKISAHKSQIFCLVFVIFCLIGGLALTIAAATTSASFGSSSYLFVILIGIGMGTIVFAPFCYIIGSCIIRRRRATKMRQAVAEESKKYSMRSPALCSWRLHVATRWTPYGRHNRLLYFYHVIIDIRHPAAPGGSARLHPNQVASRPTPTAPPQDDIVPPPPYPGNSAGFCSQCGVPRPNSTAKFCSTCGYPFDKY